MKNTTLLMIGIIGAISMLSAAVVVPIQQASAQSTSFTFSQNQNNRCSGNAGCSNTGTITFSTRPPVCPTIC